jgi:hydrogenase maturation protease
MKGKILVACVGNIFLGDDAFGVEVAQHLGSVPLPECVLVKDFGIRSYDLAYALMEEWDLVILVDAVSQGGNPGTVYIIEPETPRDTEPNPTLDAHTMNPASVLQMVSALGGTVDRMLVVGCEPASLEADESGRIGLSEVVQSSVDQAIQVIQELISKNKRATAA